MSFWRDLFGGTDDSAQKATLAQNRESIDYTKEMSDRAYKDVLRMFGPSQDNLSIGAQSAIDYMQDATPRRATILQQGNQRSRQATLAGLDQIQNAILGLPVDMSSMQFDPLQMPAAERVTVPQFRNASEFQQQQEAPVFDFSARSPRRNPRLGEEFY